MLFIGVFLSCSNLSKKEDVTENIPDQIVTQDTVAFRDSLFTEALEEEDGKYKSPNDIRLEISTKTTGWTMTTFAACASIWMIIITSFS